MLSQKHKKAFERCSFVTSWRLRHLLGEIGTKDLLFLLFPNNLSPTHASLGRVLHCDIFWLPFLPCKSFFMKDMWAQVNQGGVRIYLGIFQASDSLDPMLAFLKEKDPFSKGNPLLHVKCFWHLPSQSEGHTIIINAPLLKKSLDFSIKWPLEKAEETIRVEIFTWTFFKNTGAEK